MSKIWLSQLIKKECSPAREFSIITKTKILLVEPSQITKLLLLFLIIGAIAVSLSQRWPLLYQGYITKSQLIETHAGICLIIFALLIFIIEAAKQQQDKLRVLMFKSFIYSISISAIYVFIIIAFSPLSWVNVVFVALIGMLTICSTATVVDLMLNKLKFRNARLDLFQQRFQQCISQEANERIGNNLLASYCKKNIGNSRIAVGFYNPDKSRYLPIVLKKSGVITDIKVDALRSINDLITKQVQVTDMAGENPDITDSKPRKEIKKDLVLLIRPYFSNTAIYDGSTSTNDGVIGWLNKKFASESKNFRKAISKLVKIDTKKSNFANQVQTEIEGLESECIGAIIGKDIPTIKECSMFYTQLAMVFSKYLYKINKGYSSNDAKSDVNGFVGGWDQINWLRDAIRRLIEVAIQSNNIEIIGQIIYIPFSIIKRTFQYNDHYNFLTFISFAILIYSHRSSAEKDKIQDFLVDRSWRYLLEINSYYLLPQLESECEIGAYTESTFNFAAQFFLVFIELLVLAFQQKNTDDFTVFLTNIEEINNRTYVSKADKALKKLSKLKRQLLFCLGAWIVHQLQASNSDQHEKMLKNLILKLPEDICDTTDIFLKSISSDFDSRYNFSKHYTIPDGHVHQIPQLESHQNFYLLLVLKIASSQKLSALEKISLPHDQHFSSLIADTSHGLIKQLDDIEAKRACWSNLIPSESFQDEKISVIKSLLSKAAKQQEQETLTCVRRSQLNPRRCNDFIGCVLSAYNQTFSLKYIFQSRKNNLVELRDINRKFGYNLLIPKDMLVDCGEIVSFHLYAPGLGRDLVISENKEIFQQLMEKCNTTITTTQLDSYIGENFKSCDDVLILANSELYLHDLTKNNKSFKMQWQIDQRFTAPKTIKGAHIDYYYNWQKEWLPIYQIEKTTDQDILLVFNKRYLLHVLQDIFPKDDKVFLNNEFYINLRACSHDSSLKERLLQEEPAWLTSYGGKEKQIEYLEQRVLFEMYEHFSLEFSANFSGARIVEEQIADSI